jgi:hypothetical protein
MKNLPDDELFNAVENRLRNYSELPDDDVWERISGATPPAIEPKWIIWINSIALTLSLVVLFSLFYRNNGQDGFAINDLPDNNVGSEKRVESIVHPEASESALKNLPDTDKKDSRINEKPGTHISHRRTDLVEINSSHPINTSSDRRNSNVKIFALEVQNKIDGRMDKSEDDSVSVVTKQLKEDSAAVVGHVLPPQKKRKKAKLMFYSMISPSLSFQHVTPDSQDGVVIGKINSPGVISLERFGFTIETGIQGQMGKRFQYIFGLSYYQQSQRLEYEGHSNGITVESGEDLSFVIRPESITSSFDYSMRNVGVQAGILYTLKQRGLMHKPGLVFQYQKGMMQAHEGAVYDNSSSDYFNFQLVYRVEYALRSGVGLFIQPAYTHSIAANESLNAPFKLKQSRASLGVGIVYRF